MPLSLTTDFLDEGGAIEPKLRLFAEAGFSHVHWCEHWATEVCYEDFYTEGVGQILARLNLRLLDTHNAETNAASPSAAEESARIRGLKLLRNRIRFTAQLGGDCVVVHPGPSVPVEDSDRELFKKRWANLERSFQELAPECAASQVRLGLENLSKPLPDEFHALMEKCPPSLLGFCFDSGHANMAGNAALLERYGSRLAALHLHDNHGTKDEHNLPGEGTVDWKNFLHVLRASGYAKPLNFELVRRDTERTPEEFVREAYRRASLLSKGITTFE